MNKYNLYKVSTFCIALVWFINGLYCKVLNGVPRHEQIVASILGDEHSKFLTVLIGISEIVMSIWILTNYKSKINALIQITIIILMNVLEFILVPDLLLWGSFNSIFAILFVSFIYYIEFVVKAEIEKSPKL